MSKLSQTVKLKKKVCPLKSKAQFLLNAPPLIVDVGGTPMRGEPRCFNPDKDGKYSIGYFVNGKAPLTVDGVACQVQVSCNVTIINSKELSDTHEEAAPAEAAPEAKV